MSELCWLKTFDTIAITNFVDCDAQDLSVYCVRMKIEVYAGSELVFIHQIDLAIR